jgi:predicted RND superfamily exporter protein
MVTTLATLTYLHSRFIDHPEGATFEDHQLFALRNKLRPIGASTVAAAAGFAALAVSHILPIRQMGLWTALGLAISWLVSYTLFPALQRVLRTPTSQRVAVRVALYDRVARAIPGFTRRYRWPIVVTAAALALAGAVSLAGMPVRIDALSNLSPGSRVYRDMAWFRAHVMDLNIARVWIHLPDGTATEPEVLRAVDRLQRALEAAPDVTGVSGPATPLRMRRYLAGHGERLPDDPDQFAAAVADVEQLLMTEPELRAFIAADTLADLQINVLFRDRGAAALTDRVAAAWATVAADPALAGAEIHVVGEARLQAKIAADLIPTLVASFALAAAFIFVVFVVIFRSATARLLAMIPSLFALLVTFLGLRLAGGALNVATILIATTVLGTTENDQLHFFHHLHEPADPALEPRLRHTLRVAGRAVVFATLINAIGFLGLATSSFPPLRQFGALTAAAFVAALAADLLVLPAALWLVRGRPPPSA